MNEQWPELEEAKKIELARDAVKNLFQDELVQLYRLEVQCDEPTLIPSEEASSVVDRTESWQPGDSYIGFAATDKGEETNFTK